MENRRSRLEHLHTMLLRARSLPLKAYRRKNGYQPVLGDGNPDAAIVFIGEAPGRKEAETGLPFIGSAGKILNRLFDAAGIARTDIYITNIVNDRPPGNRDPSPEEITAYAPYTFRVLSIIRPRIIVTLGRISQRTVMSTYGLSDRQDVIGAIHGQEFSCGTPFGKAKYYPLYHPAAAIYNRSLMPVMIDDMKSVAAAARTSRTPSL